MTRKLAALLAALLVPALAGALEMLPSHEVMKLTTAINLPMVIEPLAYSAGTVNPWSFAYSAPTSNLSVKEVQGTTSPVTRAPPTIAVVGTDAGLSLANPQLPANQQGTAGVVVTVCAAATRTLSGAGTIEFYVYDPALPEWSYVKDLSLTVNATTRCQTFPGIWINVAKGRLFAAATGVTFSAGTAGVTVFMVVR